MHNNSQVQKEMNNNLHKGMLSPQSLIKICRLMHQGAPQPPCFTLWQRLIVLLQVYSIASMAISLVTDIEQLYLARIYMQEICQMRSYSGSKSTHLTRQGRRSLPKTFLFCQFVVLHDCITLGQWIPFPVLVLVFCIGRDRYQGIVGLSAYGYYILIKQVDNGNMFITRKHVRP